MKRSVALERSRLAYDARTGEFRLVHNGRTLWTSSGRWRQRSFRNAFGDDGFDLGDISDAVTDTSGNLSDIANSAEADVSSLANDASSGNYTGVASTVGNIVSAVDPGASGAVNAITGVASNIQGIASNISSGNVSGIISGLSGAASTIAKGVIQSSGPSKSASPVAVPSLSPSAAPVSAGATLTTPAGAANAAHQISQAFNGGDWLGAAQSDFAAISRTTGEKNAGGQAVDVAKAVAPAAVATTLAIVMAACTAAGSTVFGVGAIVGAVVGAISCAVIVLLGEDHTPSDNDELQGANTIQDAYELKPNWFAVSTPGAKSGRDIFFSTITTDYTKAMHDGRTPWDVALAGHANNGPNRPLIALDYALWLAQNSAGFNAFLKADPGLRTTIEKMMPIAIATINYMCYVPVLAAPGCYSPAAIQAVRQAAIAQVQPAGKQVVACMQLSLPADDITLLMYAYHFCYYDGDVGDPRTSHRPTQLVSYMTTRTGMWGVGSTVAANLATIIGQAVWAKTQNITKANALLEQINDNIAGVTMVPIGTNVHPGWSVKSPNGQYTLTFQSDGNLVLTDPTHPIWATGTNGKGATQFSVQTDGNLVVYAGSNPVWASNTNGKGATLPTSFLAIQNDGNLVLCTEVGVCVWATNTSNRVDLTGIPISPKGLSTLQAAVSVASKKPVVKDCLLGQTSAQIEQKIGLATSVGPIAQAAAADAKAANTAKVAAAKAAAQASAAMAAAAKSTALTKANAAKSDLHKKIAIAGGAAAGLGLFAWGVLHAVKSTLARTVKGVG